MHGDSVYLKMFERCFPAGDEMHVCPSTGIGNTAQKMDRENRQSLENVLLVANNIGKLLPGVHITFHADNVLQRCKLLGVANSRDQVKVLLLTVNLDTWSSLPDHVKEGRADYNETVDELLKILYPFDLGLIAAFRTKQENNENPLLYANRLWSAYYVGKRRNVHREDPEYKTILISNAHPKFKSQCGFFINPLKDSYQCIMDCMHNFFHVARKSKSVKSKIHHQSTNNTCLASHSTRELATFSNRKRHHYNYNASKDKICRHGPAVTSQRQIATCSPLNVNPMESDLRLQHRKSVLKELTLITTITSLENEIELLKSHIHNWENTNKIMETSQHALKVKYEACHADLGQCNKELKEIKQSFDQIVKVPQKTVCSIQTQNKGRRANLSILSARTSPYGEQNLNISNVETAKEIPDLMCHSDVYDLSNLFSPDPSVNVSEHIPM